MSEVPQGAFYDIYSASYDNPPSNPSKTFLDSFSHFHAPARYISTRPIDCLLETDSPASSLDSHTTVKPLGKMSFSTPIFDRPIPLTFDRVADNVPITSQTLLFQFPLELVANIVQHLAPPDLAALALVDSDCRQLARSIQFSRLILDMDREREKGGLRLLEALEAEEGAYTRKSRPRSDSVVSTASTHSRRLGPCVRHVKVAHRACHAAPITSPARQVVQDTNTLRDDIPSRIRRVCSSSTGILPNLITLDWDAPFHHDTFHLLSLAARHLRVNLSKFEPSDLGTPTCPSIDTPKPLGLESLIVDVTDASKTRPEAILPLLRSASQTLRTLVWRNLDRQLLLLPVEVIACMVSLPALRQVHLEGITVGAPVPSPTSTPIVPSKLRDLSIEGCTGSVYDHLALLGPLPALRSLRLASHPYLHSTLASRHVFGSDDLGSLCRLLQNNSHVQALDISQPIPSVPVFHPSLPSALSTLSSFSDLRMLKVVFDAAPSDEALGLIAGLGCLEVLWLSAGSQGGHVGWCSEWEINHERVIDALAHSSSSRPSTSNFVDFSDAATSSYFPLYPSYSSSAPKVASPKPLPCLRTLIFTRDTYTTTPPNAPRHPLEDPRARHLEGRRYYRERKLPIGVWPEDFLSEEECLDLLGGYSGPSSGSSTPSTGEDGGEIGGASMCLGIPDVVSMPVDYEGMFKELEPVAWERWHVERMEKVAGMYFGGGGCGALERVYVGMVPVLRCEVVGGGVEGLGERDLDGRWAEDVWRGGVRGM